MLELWASVASAAVDGLPLENRFEPEHDRAEDKVKKKRLGRAFFPAVFVLLSVRICD